MIDWQKEDLSAKKDQGILRNILQAGEGHATPSDGSMVDSKFSFTVHSFESVNAAACSTVIIMMKLLTNIIIRFIDSQIRLFIYRDNK